MKILDHIEYYTNRYKIHNVYCYGSVVYGTNNKASDEDYIIVSDYKPDNLNQAQIESLDIDVTWYTPYEFQKLIDEHEISVLECLWLPEKYILKQSIPFKFNLDISKLRDSLSAKSSNSWVKFKKKFIVDKDYEPHIALKSIFHSLRILDFGIQIAKYGKIKDYKSISIEWNCLLLLYDESISKKFNNMETVDYIKDMYQDIYNKLKSEFRKVAPKE